MKNGKFEVTFLSVDKQIDGFNCRIFALDYASILLDGKSPVDARFVVNETRNHFMKCLTDAHSYLFSTLEKAVDVFFFFLKENICVEYEIRKMPPAIHLFFVKEKQHSIPFKNPSMLYYSGYMVINLKKYPLQNSHYWKLFRRNFWVFYRSPNSQGNYDFKRNDLSISRDYWSHNLTIHS